MSNSFALYAFFFRVNIKLTKDTAEMFSIDDDDDLDDDDWIDGIQEAARLPDAEVVLFREDTWEAPMLPSFDDKQLQSLQPTIMQAINKVFVAQGLPKMSQSEFTKNMGTIKNRAMSLFVVIVKYVNQPVSKAPSAKSSNNWWEFWKK